MIMNFRKEANRVSVDARQYVANHGTAPRGRGLWAFYFVDLSGQPSDEAWFAPANTLYSEAAKLAKKEAQARGAVRVVVGS